MEERRRNLPKQVEADEVDGVVRRILESNDEKHPNHARGRRDTSRSEHQRHLEFLVHRQIQRPRRRYGQDQDRQIGQGAEHGVGDEDGSLVEALRRHGRVPETVYGSADEYLDEQDGQVVARHDSDNGIRKDDNGPADTENAGNDE